MLGCYKPSLKKNIVSVKCNKAELSKMKYTWTNGH